ncbi:MAG: peptidylprolyl isomerase [Bdellovibrionota bacterium]
MKWILALFLFSSSANAVNYENPRLAGERLVLDTNLGTMEFALYAEIAPKHVAQVSRLAKLGVYDGINIYRVEKGFVAQISNEYDRATPVTQEQRAAITKIPAEFSPIRHARGILSMARFDDPNSAEVSFSILMGPAPHLDNKYTVFGRLEQGYDVLEAIENTPVDSNHVPQTKLGVLRAQILSKAEADKYYRNHAGVIAAAAPAPQPNNFLPVAFLVLNTLLAFGIVLLSPERARLRTALAHLVLLVSGVGVLTLLTPLIQNNYQVLGVFLFFGMVGIFKALGKFDAPE